MAQAIGVHASASTELGASITTAAVTTQASGSTLLAFMAYNMGAFTSVVDSKSNTWVQIGTEISDASMGSACSIFKCVGATGGSGHTLTGNATGCSAYLLELTNSDVVDQASTINLDTASPFTSGAITTTQARDALVGFVVSNNAGTASHVIGGSFASGDKVEEVTDGTHFWTGCLVAKLVTATGTYNTSFTESGANRTFNIIISVKEVAGGGAPSVTLVELERSGNRGMFRGMI